MNGIWNAVLQTVMGMIGSFGFAVLFNVRKGKLVSVAVGSGICWAVYLLVYSRTQDKVASLLVATMASGVMAEVLARVLKAPVTILLVPILVPLIPGSDLFYTTSSLVQDDAAGTALYGSLVLKEALAIAFGIILVPCAEQVLVRILRFCKKYKKIGGKEK